MASQKNFKLTLKDVKCFAGEQHFDIRPLTFLVGVNSTGKTTVMSCFSAIYKFLSEDGVKLDYPDFNEEPYFMGSFIDIVRRSKLVKEKKHIQNFEISINYNDNIKYKFCFKEKNTGAEPVMKQASIHIRDVSFCVKEEAGEILVTTKDNENDKEYKADHFSSKIDEIYKNSPFPSKNDIFWTWSRVLQELISIKYQKDSPVLRIPQRLLSDKSSKNTFYEDLEHLHNWRIELFLKKLFNLAPVRAKPKRTYDPIKESPSPEGTEIPVFLSNLKEKPEEWKKVHKNLIDFGKASGLFSNIEVRKFGKSKGAPFQLYFKVRGIKSNIVDTGYGLSQILPFLVRIFSSGGYLKKKGTHFLVQQPEDHLHPEAQAELASLLVKSIKKDHFFLIETHSDYLLDRTRIEVRKREIATDQVSIIYLHPEKEGVKVYNMSIDKDGNLIGAPQEYRKFFIKETDRFLGFKD